MKIMVNGKSREYDNSQSLKDVITSVCQDSSKVIAEVNGTIVKSPQWPETTIKDGDSIELVSFVGGG